MRIGSTSSSASQGLPSYSFDKIRLVALAILFALGTLFLYSWEWLKAHPKMSFGAGIVASSIGLIYQDFFKQNWKRKNPLSSYYISFGDAHLKAGRFGHAKEDFTQAIYWAEKNGYSYCRLAEAKRQTGDAKGALECVEVALKFTPNNPDALVCRGILNGDLEDFRAALRCNDRHFFSLMAMGAFALDHVDFNRAKESFRLANSLQPDSFIVKIGYALTSFFADNKTERLEKFASQSSILEGLLKYWKGDVVEAKKQWKSSLNRADRRGLVRAELQVALGKEVPERSPYTFLQAFTGDPKALFTNIVKALLVRSNTIMILAENGHKTKDQKKLNEALRLYPNALHPLLLRGCFFQDTYNYREAIVDLENVKRRMPENRQVRKRLAKLYEETNDFLSAREILIALGPDDATAKIALQRVTELIRLHHPGDKR